MKIIELFSNGLTVSLVAYVLNCPESFIVDVIAEKRKLTADQKKKLEKLLNFLEN